jgi:hypothetical protein
VVAIGRVYVGEGEAWLGVKNILPKSVFILILLQQPAEHIFSISIKKNRI